MSRRLLAPAVGLIGFLAAWETLVRALNVRPFVLRAPTMALTALWRFRADFASAALVTIAHASVGLAIALIVGTALGAALAAVRALDDAAQPVLVLVMVTLWFAYVSSIVLWLGAGTPPALFMVGLVCLPAVVIAATDGLRGADHAALELFRSVDASRWETFWRLRLPGALPVMFTALRVDLGLALAAAYYVEGANFANDGIGAIGRRAAAQADGADTLWAAVFAMALIGAAGLLALSVLQRIVLHWHPSSRRRIR
ncbi:MAG: ABC transporter permease [Ilumatobacteraceae bacterium]